MAHHSYELTDHQTHPRKFMPAQGLSMTATLAVRPPFDIPAAAILTDIIIGVKADRWSTRIEHTGTTPEACFFEVAAAEGSDLANLTRLQQLGERAVRYANDPTQASEMMREAPFAIQER